MKQFFGNPKDCISKIHTRDSTKYFRKLFIYLFCMLRSCDEVKISYKVVAFLGNSFYMQLIVTKL